MEFIVSIVRSVILFGLLIFIAFRIFRILRPFEKGLVERFGKYNREATAGLNIVIPGIEKLIIVDMREQVSMFHHKKLLQKTTSQLLLMQSFIMNQLILKNLYITSEILSLQQQN